MRCAHGSSIFIVLVWHPIHYPRIVEGGPRALYTPFNLYCPGRYTIHLQNLIVTVHVTVSAFSSLVVVYIPEMLVSSLNLSLNQSYECRHVHVYLEFIFKSWDVDVHVQLHIALNQSCGCQIPKMLGLFFLLIINGPYLLSYKAACGTDCINHRLHSFLCKFGISQYMFYEMHKIHHTLLSCQCRHLHFVAAFLYKLQEVSDPLSTKMWWLLASPLWCKQSMTILYMSFPSILTWHAVYWAVSKYSPRMHLPRTEVWYVWSVLSICYFQKHPSTVFLNGDTSSGPSGDMFGLGWGGSCLFVGGCFYFVVKI